MISTWGMKVQNGMGRVNRRVRWRRPPQSGEACLLTSVEVAKRFAIDDQDVARQMNQLRGAGTVSAVYWEMDGGSWRYPEWQFGKDGQPLPFLAEIIGVLRESGLFLDAQGMSTGWGELEWFMTRHALLGEFTPIEVLQADPGSVLMAVEQEFYNA